LRRAVACFGEADQPLAPPDEDFDLELALEVLDLLADPGLRGEQFIGDLRQVEVVLNRRTDISELLEIPRTFALAARVPNSGGNRNRVADLPLIARASRSKTASRAG
jgi:hypothetical protein